MRSWWLILRKNLSEIEAETELQHEQTEFRIH